MKNTYTITTSALALATLAMTITPGTAQAATFRQNPDAGITKVWQQNPGKYGQPTSNEECVTGAGCAQTFENAVITWSRTTGVKVLNGAERAAAYKEAGGIAVLGALESDAWNHSFCGTSVTTYNGKNQSRWLVVLEDGKSTAGKALDLNSEAGKKWKAERDQTRECFDTTGDNPAPVEDPKPTPVAEEVPQKYVDEVNSLAEGYKNELLGEVTSPLKKEADQLWVQRHEHASIVYNARDGKVELIETAALDYALQHLDQFGLPTHSFMDGTGEYTYILTTFTKDNLHQYQFRVQNYKRLVYAPYTATAAEPNNFKWSSPVVIGDFTNPRPAPAPQPTPQPTTPEGYVKPTVPVTPNNPKDATKSDIENAALTIDKLVSSTTGFTPSQPAGEVTHRSGVYYTQDFGNNISAIYNAEQNKAIWMNTDAVTEYLSDAKSYGSYLWYNDITTENGATTIQAVVMRVSELKQNYEDDGSILWTDPTSHAMFYLPLSLDWNNGAYMMYHGQNPELLSGFPDEVTGRVYDANLPVDTTFDWSQAVFLKLPGVLWADDAEGNHWYIQATADGKPLPGAKPVQANMLLESEALSDRPRFSAYGDWAFGDEYKMYNNMSMLGAPVSEAVEGVDANGDAYLQQEFEGGTATWYKGTEFVNASLNERGEAKKAWYDSLNL